MHSYTVIMGVSRQDGDFVVKLLNMILYLTFTTGGPVHPHGEEVLKQMPQEIITCCLNLILRAALSSMPSAPLAIVLLNLNFPMALIHPLILQLAPMYHTQAPTSVGNNYYMAPLIMMIATMS